MIKYHLLHVICLLYVLTSDIASQRGEDVVTDYLMLIIYSFVHMLCTCAVHSLPCGKNKII